MNSYESAIDFEVVYGEDIRRYTNEIAELRIEIFRSFPYLYEGDLDYERKYLDIYYRSQRSILILAKDKDTIIGVSTALPLVDENEYIQQPFKNKKRPLESIFYFGESVLRQEFRGQGIGKRYFQLREQHARSFGDYKTTCFCAVNRADNHKNRPTDYKPLDSFWISLGYEKDEELKANFSWKDIGSKTETEKSMTFWLKDWK